jgi:type II secretory pathway pseudopilin PulG
MSRPGSRGRRGFTLLQLLVLLALLAMLLGFLFSAVGRVRLADATTQSQNNLKEIALGTIDFAAAQQGRLPPGPENWFPSPKAPKAAYGPCLFHITPYLEGGETLHRSTFTKVGDKSVFASWRAAGKVVKPYIASADPTADPKSDGTSYLANELAMPAAGARFPASFTDGTSNTILYTEAYSQATDTLTWEGKKHTWKTPRRWWDNPTWKPVEAGQPRQFVPAKEPGKKPGWEPTVQSDLPFQLAPAKDAASVSLPQGFAPEGMNVALADASVRRVSGKVSATTFYAACTPSGGDIPGADW